MANEDVMMKTQEQNVLARFSLFSYAFTLMTDRVNNLEENRVFF